MYYIICTLFWLFNFCLNSCWSFSYSFQMNHQPLVDYRTSTLKPYSAERFGRLCQLGAKGIYAGLTAQSKSCYYFCDDLQPKDNQQNVRHSKPVYHCCPKDSQMNLSLKLCVSTVNSTKIHRANNFNVESRNRKPLQKRNRNVDRNLSNLYNSHVNKINKDIQSRSDSGEIFYVNDAPISRCDQGLIKSHSSDCNKYFQCVFNRYYIEMKCPFGSKWNSVSKICDSKIARCSNYQPTFGPESINNGKPLRNNRRRYVPNTSIVNSLWSKKPRAPHWTYLNRNSINSLNRSLLSNRCLNNRGQRHFTQQKSINNCITRSNSIENVFSNNRVANRGLNNWSTKTQVQRKTNFRRRFWEQPSVSNWNLPPTKSTKIEINYATKTSSNSITNNRHKFWKRPNQTKNSFNLPFDNKGIKIPTITTTSTTAPPQSTAIVSTTNVNRNKKRKITKRPTGVMTQTKVSNNSSTRTKNVNIVPTKSTTVINTIASTNQRRRFAKRPVSKSTTPLPVIKRTTVTQSSISRKPVSKTNVKTSGKRKFWHKINGVKGGSIPSTPTTASGVKSPIRPTTTSVPSIIGSTTELTTTNKPIEVTTKLTDPNFGTTPLLSTTTETISSNVNSMETVPIVSNTLTTAAVNDGGTTATTGSSTSEVDITTAATTEGSSTKIVIDSAFTDSISTKSTTEISTKTTDSIGEEISTKPTTESSINITDTLNDETSTRPTIESTTKTTESIVDEIPTKLTTESPSSSGDFTSISITTEPSSVESSKIDDQEVSSTIGLISTTETTTLGQNVTETVPTVSTAEEKITTETPFQPSSTELALTTVSLLPDTSQTNKDELVTVSTLPSSSPGESKFSTIKPTSSQMEQTSTSINMTVSSTLAPIVLEENGVCYEPTSRYKDTDDCQCFYECEFNYRLTRNCCPEGLYFNQVEFKPNPNESDLEESEDQPVCDLPENVQCKTTIQ